MWARAWRHDEEGERSFSIFVSLMENLMPIWLLLSFKCLNVSWFLNILLIMRIVSLICFKECE
ncbi:hypothetical protein RchiOBHm_Chr1g0355781 [Rosa chinensis]|uniref:Uncharacterized protein n=1 Tax=Rosa chinensis TaxID=74649 RepID=A0A2P6SHH0_ROSCH|nr:hypothetical protein RchiOBHm_Chr1g0355781 [Rosa chinensis]